MFIPLPTKFIPDTTTAQHSLGTSTILTYKPSTRFEEDGETGVPSSSLLTDFLL